MYIVAQYLNPDTNRRRWAVMHVPTSTWYFPKGRGKMFAVRLQQKLKKGTT